MSRFGRSDHGFFVRSNHRHRTKGVIYRWACGYGILDGATFSTQDNLWSPNKVVDGEAIAAWAWQAATTSLYYLVKMGVAETAGEVFTIAASDSTTWKDNKDKDAGAGIAANFWALDKYGTVLWTDVNIRDFIIDGDDLWTLENAGTFFAPRYIIAKRNLTTGAILSTVIDYSNTGAADAREIILVAAASTGSAFVRDSDGNFIIVGSSSGIVNLLKINSSGTVLQAKVVSNTASGASNPAVAFILNVSIYNDEIFCTTSTDVRYIYDDSEIFAGTPYTAETDLGAVRNLLIFDNDLVIQHHISTGGNQASQRTFFTNGKIGFQSVLSSGEGIYNDDLTLFIDNKNTLAALHYNTTIDSEDIYLIARLALGDWYSNNDLGSADKTEPSSILKYNSTTKDYTNFWNTVKAGYSSVVLRDTIPQ